MRKASLRRKLTLGFGVFIPALAVNSLVGYVAVGKLEMSLDSYRLADEKRKLALVMQSAIEQQRAERVESTVVKPSRNFLHRCSGLAGANLSGDGRVRLVFDPAGLLAASQGMAPAIRKASA